MDWWVNDLKSSPLDSINRLIDKRSMTSDTPATGTRLNLIRSGLRLFGQRGYEATSTRALAEQAREAFAVETRPADQSLAKVDAWLAAHPG